ncbi:DUF4262 domain-containing protein [Marivirga lumbricoides]|uniref:DUF4262 domain-containing protein n=1 Tax=Marivirga lumbricoides TaxID=1046115 RepID=A0A2T4DTV7_9BACT|nr:DUF4262 domain-containing protein [Marivirga lumbricoides]
MENHKEHDKQAKERIVSDIKEYDCHLALIESDGYLPAFVYSIGLFETFQHPEVIVFGLKTDVMGNIINHIRDEIRAGKTFNSGTKYSGFLEGFEIQFLDVNKDSYPDYFGYAGWYYKNNFDFPALQLVWPDKESRWPWEHDFNSNWKFKQPLLDRNMNFKFHEETNLGVFTTHHALEGKPILYVYHNEDGDWQFHTEYEPNIEDSKIVCLKDILDKDPTLNEIYHLGYGQTAYRSEIGTEWSIEEMELDPEIEEEVKNSNKKPSLWSKLKSRWSTKNG